MPKLKVLKQKDSEACGPACIKMIADYFELPISLNQIGKISEYKKRGGLSNKDLVETFRKLGLEVRTRKNAKWSDLKKYNTPHNVIVVSWMMSGYIGHFSLLEKATASHIYLADPAKGKITKLVKIIFLRLWLDYDDKWFPVRNADIQLRWMAIVSRKK